MSKPNGIDMSPLDQRILYAVEHDIRISDRRHGAVPTRDKGEMRILADDLEDGVAANQRVLVDYGDEKGADGIAVDNAGNIYAAVQSATRPGVRVYNPSGLLLAEIATPGNTIECRADGSKRSHLALHHGVDRTLPRRDPDTADSSMLWTDKFV